jgi:hypothetical protein
MQDVPGIPPASRGAIDDAPPIHDPTATPEFPSHPLPGGAGEALRAVNDMRISRKHMPGQFPASCCSVVAHHTDRF